MSGLSPEAEAALAAALAGSEEIIASGDRALAEFRETVSGKDFDMPDPATGELRSAKAVFAEFERRWARDRASIEIYRNLTTRPAGSTGDN